MRLPERAEQEERFVGFRERLQVVASPLSYRGDRVVGVGQRGGRGSHVPGEVDVVIIPDAVGVHVGRHEGGACVPFLA